MSANSLKPKYKLGQKVWHLDKATGKALEQEVVVIWGGIESVRSMYNRSASYTLKHVPDSNLEDDRKYAIAESKLFSSKRALLKSI